MADGIDVRGMYYWTLLDNFEWNAGYGVKFGLYAWSPDAKGVGDRTPRTTCAVLVRGGGECCCQGEGGHGAVARGKGGSCREAGLPQHTGAQA